LTGISNLRPSNVLETVQEHNFNIYEIHAKSNVNQLILDFPVQYPIKSRFPVLLSGPMKTSSRFLWKPNPFQYPGPGEVQFPSIWFHRPIVSQSSVGSLSGL